MAAAATTAAAGSMAAEATTAAAGNMAAEHPRRRLATWRQQQSPALPFNRIHRGGFVNRHFFGGQFVINNWSNFGFSAPRRGALDPLL